MMNSPVTMRRRWPMLSDSLYLAAQLAKVALVCAGIYAFTWFMLSI